MVWVGQMKKQSHLKPRCACWQGLSFNPFCSLPPAPVVEQSHSDGKSEACVENR